MVPIPTSQTSHRKNRRRERPGARKRHALALAHEVAEGMSMASDHSFDLPFHHSHAQSRQHNQYDRNWKAWKAREEEYRIAAIQKENSARQREKDEYTRLFGGEADDDTPRAFSISFASLKKIRQRASRVEKQKHRRPNIVPARRPAFAMSLPLRPAKTAQIEQLPLPAFTAAQSTQTIITKTTSPQSLPTTADPRVNLWNSSSTAFTLPFHPATSSVSTTTSTSQQQHPHTSPAITSSETKIWPLPGDDS